MRQPDVIIWPLISPSSGAPSDMSGKSESSTDRCLTSEASIFSRLARSLRAFSTAPSLLFAMTSQTTLSQSLFRVIGYILSLLFVMVNSLTKVAEKVLQERGH